MPPSPWLSARMTKDEVLDGDDEGQRPEDEREHAEHVRAASGATPCGPGEALLQRVERARADVAVDDAERAERELRQRAPGRRDAVASNTGVELSAGGGVDAGGVDGGPPR